MFICKDNGSPLFNHQVSVYLELVIGLWIPRQWGILEGGSPVSYNGCISGGYLEVPTNHMQVGAGARSISLSQK